MTVIVSPCEGCRKRSTCTLPCNKLEALLPSPNRLCWQENEFEVLTFDGNIEAVASRKRYGLPLRGEDGVYR